MKHGWYPATEALNRFGSAAAGDPLYEAGDALGKLLRTLYLCDYFGNPVFRLEILDLLKVTARAMNGFLAFWPLRNEQGTRDRRAGKPPITPAEGLP